MKNKKGISDIIAWVLLIGFTIAMAAFVSTWVIEQTKKFNPEDIAGGAKVYCEEVVLSIEEKPFNYNGGVDCISKLEENSFLGEIKLKNRGKFTIYKIKGLGPGIGPGSIGDFTFGELKPGESDTIKIGFTCKSPNQIELVPEIKVDGKEYYCSDNSAIINDDLLH